MSYKHISSSQRNELSALLRADLKQNKIAELLGKSPSAISQELKRNPAATKMGYDAESKKDFQHKIGICKKESRETKHWLRMTVVIQPELKDEARKLWQEAKELNLIFNSINNKLRNR